MRGAVACLVVLLVSGCDPGVRIGGSCTYTSECPTPLTCSFGRCRAECLENRDCPLDAMCLLDPAGEGTCSLADDPDCRDPGETCAAGLACIGGECVNACDSVAQCPPDSVCSPAEDGRARCIRAELADAGPSDAATVDAATIDGGASCSGASCVVEIDAGGASTCARTMDGSVWCWGTVYGDGTTRSMCAAYPCAPAPVRVVFDDGTGAQPLVGALALASSNSSACAILADRGVACWGAGWAGQLGSTTSDGLVARRVAGAGAAYLDHVIALSPSNEGWFAVRDEPPLLVGWGDAHEAAFLAGIGTIEATPVEVPAPAFDELESGGWHACLRSGATVQCWGKNDESQAGGPAGDAPLTTPTTVAGLSAPSAVVASARGACAIDGDDASCWGAGYVLGGGGEAPGPCYCRAAARPVVRPAGVMFRELFSTPSSDTMFALDQMGRVWCWGYNAAGGTCVPGGPYSVDIPTLRRLPAGVESIALGYEHACALAGGIVYCWGRDDDGQAGTGTAGPVVTEPTAVAIPHA